ncbi:MAG: enoyl-CoA hydratase [Myxococcota bacterium]|jgi:enoyl-CoA hydratase
MPVETSQQGAVTVVTINRPETRNAVDRGTSEALAKAFRDFEADDTAKAAVLWGRGGHFCAGADLKAVAAGHPPRLSPDGDGPLGPTRMRLSKPVIAAVSGYAVAGGLELALWCDLRVVEESAIFGVFCRRFGVPLIDGGSVRLPRIVGQGRALDMILTGRPVGAEEARQMGLATRLCPDGEALQNAVALATEIIRHPTLCMTHDRASTYASLDLSHAEAMDYEFTLGMATLESGETLSGAGRFARGEGRHGTFSDDGD